MCWPKFDLIQLWHRAKPDLIGGLVPGTDVDILSLCYSTEAAQVYSNDTSQLNVEV